MLVGDEGSSVEGDIVTPLAISYHSSHLDIIWLWKNEDKSVSPRCILRSLKGNIQTGSAHARNIVYFRINLCKLCDGPIRLLADHDFTVRCIQVELTRPLDGTFKQAKSVHF